MLAIIEQLIIVRNEFRALKLSLLACARTDYCCMLQYEKMILVSVSCTR